MMRLRLLVFWISLLAAAGPTSAAEPSRIALLIGNKDYNEKVGPLANPLNDVALVERSLKQLGFAVTKVENADRRAMDNALTNYIAELKQAKGDAIGFFYYSGHGASNPERQTNYLVPVDVPTANDETLWLNSLSQTEIVDRLMRQANNAFHYVVLDACRDELRLSSGNKSLGTEKGFVPVVSSSGVLIAYATSPGHSASDSGWGAGPYARALAAELLNKENPNTFTMFGVVAQRVTDETGHKQEPWFSASPVPKFASRLAASPSLIPARLPPSKEGTELPAYAEVVVSDVDYLSELRGGLFNTPNAIGLDFDNDGTRNRALVGVGRASRSYPMKYVPAEQLNFQLVELQTFGAAAISNVQTMNAAELGQARQLKFRIRDNTFAANPDIDKRKKTVSLTVRLVPFDPQKLSGDDGQEEGARTFGPQSMSDTVSFPGQDAIDYVRLAAGKGVCVIRLPSRDHYEARDVTFSVKDTRSRSKFEPVKALSDLLIWTTPCDAALNTTFRVVAEPLAGGGRYDIALIQDTARAADFTSVAETMLSDFVGAPIAGARQDESERLATFLRSVGELRRSLKVDEPSRLLKQFEEHLLSSDQNRFSRTVAALIESDSPFYRAAADSPVLRVHLTLYRGESDKPYDKAVLLEALQSRDGDIAARAIRILGKLKDPGFVRTTLMPFALDPRDEVASAARQQILALNRSRTSN